MSLIILTIQLFEHHPFLGRIAFEHPCLKLLFHYPNTYSLRSLNRGRWTSTSLRQSLWNEVTAKVTLCLLAYYRHFWTSTKLLVTSKYLQDSYCHCGAQMGVAKCVLAFNSFCRARTRVAKFVLAFDSHCGAQTGVAKHVLVFDSLCGAQTGVAKCVLAFDSLCGPGTGIAKHIIAFDSLCGAWTGEINSPNIHT